MPRRATVVEAPDELPPEPPQQPAARPEAASPEPRPHDTPTSRLRQTRFAAGGAEPAGEASGAACDEARRIQAVLVTYTWRQGGQVFPVREGRNYLGSDAGCEIALSADSEISGRHATIVCRGNRFWIDDEKSMNGTFLNERLVEEKRPLPNHSVIRTGKTIWRFVALEPNETDLPVR